MIYINGEQTMLLITNNKVSKYWKVSDFKAPSHFEKLEDKLIISKKELKEMMLGKTSINPYYDTELSFKVEYIKKALINLKSDILTLYKCSLDTYLLYLTDGKSKVYIACKLNGGD